MEFTAVVQKLRKIDVSAATDKLNPVDLYYLYRIVLGREPDEWGWKFWSERARGGTPLAKAVEEFMASSEARARWRAEARLASTRRGFSIFVEPSDAAVGREIIDSGDYEPEVSTFIEREVRGATGTFVDIGSNIGWFLLLAHRAAPSMRLVGFEPNPNNVELSCRSLQNASVDRAIVYPFAATDTPCFLALQFTGSNGYVRGAEHGGTLVQGVRGADHLSNVPPVRLLKIDVEGHEPRAIEGLSSIIEKDRPVIVSEFHPLCLRDNTGAEPEAYLGQLMGLGYAISVIERGGNGSETMCAGPDEVMQCWRRCNEKLGYSGEVHLDIVARPR